MDKNTVEKLGGTITEFSILVSRKVTDGNYGSFEVSMSETVSVGTDEDALELERSYYKDLKEKVFRAVAAADMQKVMTKVVERAMQDEVHQAITEAADEAGGVEPERVEIDDAGNEYKTFAVESIEVLHSKKGAKYARAHGPQLPKRGVAVWAGVLAKEPLEWDIDELSVQVYGAPKGLQAKVLMGEFKGKPQPDQVKEWI